MASKSTAAAALLLAAFLLLALASSAMAQAAPASGQCPGSLVEAMSGLKSLSPPVAAQCVSNALRASGNGGGVTSTTQVTTTVSDGSVTTETSQFVAIPGYSEKMQFLFGVKATTSPVET